MYIQAYYCSMHTMLPSVTRACEAWPHLRFELPFALAVNLELLGQHKTLLLVSRNFQLQILVRLPVFLLLPLCIYKTPTLECERYPTGNFAKGSRG